MEFNYLKLFSFAKKRKISVAAVWEQEDLTQLLRLPEIAYNQLQNLVQRTTDIQLNEGQDIWQYFFLSKQERAGPY